MELTGQKWNCPSYPRVFYVLWSGPQNQCSSLKLCLLVGQDGADIHVTRGKSWEDCAWHTKCPWSFTHYDRIQIPWGWCRETCFTSCAFHTGVKGHKSKPQIHLLSPSLTSKQISSLSTLLWIVVSVWEQINYRHIGNVSKLKSSCFLYLCPVVWISWEKMDNKNCTEFLRSCK